MTTFFDDPTATGTGVVKWVFEDYWRGQGQSVTYYAAGLVQHFIVPDGVDQLYVQLRGGVGNGTTGAQTTGGYVTGHLAVDEGETLSIYVGGNGAVPYTTSTATPKPSPHSGGAGGWNGGGDGGDANSAVAGLIGGYGGGGATDIRQGGTALTDRVAVAAGSGGTSGKYGYGGGAGGPTGQTGWSHRGTCGGYGGTATHGGAGGLGAPPFGPLEEGFPQPVDNGGQPGSLGNGGDGDNNPNTTREGAAGGGGGGYYGGGGGGNGYKPGTATQLLTEMAGRQILGYGGGGGSNYTGGLDQDRPIHSGSGLNYSQIPGHPPQPAVKISYAQTPFSYTMAINPSDGGTPVITKNIQMSQNTGPNRVNILQEGQSTAPTLSFSGVTVNAAQLENLEYWFDRRVFIRITDDLSREFYGVFNSFSPKRARRSSNFWYHTYDAEFTLSAYKNASGAWVYGRVT